MCFPFQWNQIGMTRGVPSDQTYAKRAGIVDCSNSCAIGSLSKAISPCFVAIHLSLLKTEIRLLPQRERKQRRAGGDGNVLLAVDGVTHGAAVDLAAERHLPEQRSVVAVEGEEVAF